MKRAVKINPVQLRTLVEAEMKKALQRKNLREAGEDPGGSLRMDQGDMFYTQMQEAIQDAVDALDAFKEALGVVEGLSQEYGDPEFEFSSGELNVKYVEPLEQALEEYAQGVDATAEVDVDMRSEY